MNSLSLPRKLDDGIAYYEAGPVISEGRVAYLLLHGLGNSLDYWAAIAPALSERGRVVAIDMPGFGRSPEPTGGFSLEHLSRAPNRTSSGKTDIGRHRSTIDPASSLSSTGRYLLPQLREEQGRRALAAARCVTIPGD